MPDQPPSPQPPAGYELRRMEYHISRVAHGIRLLRTQIERRHLQHGRSTSAGALAEILLRLLWRLHDKLRSLYEEIDIHPPQDTIRPLQFINYVITRMVPKLEQAMVLAETQTVIAPVMEAYMELTSSVSYGTQAIIHPTLGYNASFDEIMEQLEDLASEVGHESRQTVLSGAPPSFVIITYPMAEQDTVLRQAYLAHEMGHYIDRVLKLSDLLNDNLAIEEKDRKRVQTASQARRPECQSQPAGPSLVRLLIEYASFWRRELTADFLGLCMLGPAYLLAFDEITFAPSSYPDRRQIHRSHPPVQLRKALMADLLKEGLLDPVLSSKGFASLDALGKEVFGTVCGFLEELRELDDLDFRTIQDAPWADKEAVNSFYQSLRNVLAEASDYLMEFHLTELSGRSWFCGVVDLLDACQLQSLLANGLIPTKLGLGAERDPSFAAVMNAGWFHLLHAAEQYQCFSRLVGEVGPDHRGENFMRLQELVSKAIEALHFKREFNRSKGEPKDCADEW